MGFEDLFAILKALITGKKGLIEVIAEDPRLILLPFITGAITVALVYFKHKDGPKAGPGLAAFVSAGVMAAALVFLPGPRSVGQPPQPPDPPSIRFETHDGMRLTGRALAPPVASPTAGECEARCARETECRGYVFDLDSKTCSLKAEAGTFARFDGSKAGLRMKK
jgi:hypothetical protein